MLPDSDLGQRYLGAMRAAINCALANRQILTHHTRAVFGRFFPGLAMPPRFDVSHNTCKLETHTLERVERRLHVHRKGATRAFGPGHPSLPEDLRATGQRVLISVSMGTASWMLAGTAASEALAFSSAFHGAGHDMSRHQALRRWSGRQLVDELASRGILSAVARPARLPRRRPAPTRTWTPWWRTPPTGPPWRGGCCGWSRASP
jgi:tRNA-splicing ligase RtcB